MEYHATLISLLLGVSNSCSADHPIKSYNVTITFTCIGSAVSDGRKWRSNGSYGFPRVQNYRGATKPCWNGRGDNSNIILTILPMSLGGGQGG